MNYFLIANAGIYIELNNTSFLIDALFNGSFKYFSSPKSNIPFSDYVLFTHKHNDHYNKEELNKYLMKNPNSHFLIEDCEFDSLKIKMLNSKHIGIKKENNNVIYIESSETKVLITGDSDDNYQFYLDNKLKADIVFINPAFLASKNGINILKDIINPRLAVIYHLPSIDDNVDLHYLNITKNYLYKLDELNIAYQLLNIPNKIYEFK